MAVTIFDVCKLGPITVQCIVYPFLGFVFQFIARHLLYTPERVIVVGSFATSHHYCPMSVQPPSALTVTEKLVLQGIIS